MVFVLAAAQLDALRGFALAVERRDLLESAQVAGKYPVLKDLGGLHGGQQFLRF